jgi:hypothetical protein
MLLLEHDAKEVPARCRLPVPPGVLIGEVIPERSPARAVRSSASDAR